MRIAVVALSLFIFAAHAADKPAPAKVVFVVSGLECGSCVYMVQLQLSQTPGIAEAEVSQGVEGSACVSYDPKLITEHQIAQAVREAPGLHGMPYIATMKLRVPGFAQHATKVKLLFDKWKPWIEVVVWDEHAGDLIVNFVELKKDDKGAFPRGWSLAQLSGHLRTLGLKCEVLSPGEL
jgi:copper chaperone CopZ